MKLIAEQEASVETNLEHLEASNVSLEAFHDFRDIPSQETSPSRALCAILNPNPRERFCNLVKLLRPHP